MADHRSFSFYEDLRTSKEATFRAVQQPNSNSGRALHVVSHPDLDTEVTLCHVPIFLRYSMYDEATETFQDVSSASYGGTAGALLAMHHFNNGDGSIVKELGGIHERCNIRFTTEVIDTQSSPIAAVKSLAGDIINREETDFQVPPACAIMGAAWYTISRSMATVTGVYDLLQVSPSSSSMSLDSMSQYPLFARTHPSDEAKGLLAVEYFREVLGIQNFGVFFVNSEQGISLQKTILDAASRSNMTAHSVAFDQDASAESLRNSLLQLEEMGFNYFVGVLFPLPFEKVMEIAAEVGVAGRGKYWLVTGHLAEVFASGNTTIGTDSYAAKGSTGIGVLHDDGEYGLAHYDNFARHWKKIGRNEEALDYINSKQPAPPDESSNMTFTRLREYFDLRPSHYSQYSYDAVVGMGTAACRAAMQSDRPDNFFTGHEHLEQLVSHSFDGATGKVTFPNASNTRDGFSTNYFLSEIHEIDRPKLDTSVFSGATRMYFDPTHRRWEQFPGAGSYVYSDGTLRPPSELPAYVENRHIVGIPLQVVCIVLAALVMLTSIGLSVFTFIKRKHEIIRASQPPFLYMLCLGTLVMSSAIIPLGIDDSVTNDDGCSIACMARVWLASIGFTITFSALFSKTWRINKLMKKSRGCRRVTVTPGDVIKPFCALFLINVLILALWTALAPLEWKREALQYDRFDREVESMGACYSDGWLPYGVVLFVVNFLALTLCIVEAYRARNINTEFSESKYIAMAVVCIFQAMFVGIPLIFLTKDSPTAHCFVIAAMIFVVCMAVLLLIFIPKITYIRTGPKSSLRQSIGRYDCVVRRASSLVSHDGQSASRAVIEGLGAALDGEGSGQLEQDLRTANDRIVVLQKEIEKLKQPKQEDDDYSDANDVSDAAIPAQVL